MLRLSKKSIWYSFFMIFLVIVIFFLVSCGVFEPKTQYDLSPKEFLNKNILGLFEDNTLTLAAEIHYWRIFPDTWKERLKQTKEASITTISTYVPWNFHEYELDKYDLTGTTDPRRNLEGFLQLCEEFGMKVIIRPGPYINAEWKGWGYPYRILADDEILVKGPDGKNVEYQAQDFWDKEYTQKPMVGFPAYQHPKYLAEVAKWYDAVCPVIRKHAVDNGGCIILIQPDNEICHHFIMGAYQLDYNPETIKLYHLWLKKEYGNLKKLNTIYQTKYGDFSDIEPPKKQMTDAKFLPYYFDWARFREFILIEYINVLHKMIKDRQIKLPILTNVIGYGIQNYREFSQVSNIVGQGFHQPNYPGTCLIDLWKYNDATTSISWSGEFMSGTWNPYAKVTVPDISEKFQMVNALAYEVKGFVLYMFVDRDIWQDGAIGTDGEIRSKYYLFKKMAELMRDNNPIKYRRMTDVALLHYRPYYWASYLGISGLKHDNSAVHSGFRNDFFWYLQSNDVDFDITDIVNVGNYKLVFAPLGDFIAQEDARKLISYVKDGGTLVIFPDVPDIDLDGLPMNEFRRIMNIKDKSEATLSQIETAYGRGKFITLNSWLNKSDDKVLNGILNQAEVISYASTDDKGSEAELHISGKNEILLYVINREHVKKGVKVFLNLDFLQIKPGDKLEITNVMLNQKIFPDGKDYMWSEKELKNGIAIHFDGQDATIIRIVRNL